MKDILQNTTNLLNSLFRIAGMHSLLLTIDPKDNNDEGFLGGSPSGREFWLSMRNGGATGMHHFKQFCRDNGGQSLASSSDTGGSSSVLARNAPPTQVIRSGKSTPAVILKNQLYVEMRNALR